MARLPVCRLARFSRAGYYRQRWTMDQSALHLRIRDMAQGRPRFGYQLTHLMLCGEG